MADRENEPSEIEKEKTTNLMVSQWSSLNLTKSSIPFLSLKELEDLNPNKFESDIEVTVPGMKGSKKVHELTPEEFLKYCGSVNAPMISQESPSVSQESATTSKSMKELNNLKELLSGYESIQTIQTNFVELDGIKKKLKADIVALEK
ncbi:unnamed protein product [Caenorhabditis angaria]|uniref:Uncharacterized protein n=1 Tax=Caenorhabditis angaria TaxID=860376 RepID=A0A9P1J185_9PELO|nr:unnamed protein product [Caenorhabditis angaria]